MESSVTGLSSIWRSHYPHDKNSFVTPILPQKVQRGWVVCLNALRNANEIEFIPMTQQVILGQTTMNKLAPCPPHNHRRMYICLPQPLLTQSCISNPQNRPAIHTQKLHVKTLPFSKIGVRHRIPTAIILHFLLGLTLTILCGLQRPSMHMAQSSRPCKHFCYHVGDLVGGGSEVDAFCLGGRVCFFLQCSKEQTHLIINVFAIRFVW